MRLTSTSITSSAGTDTRYSCVGYCGPSMMLILDTKKSYSTKLLTNDCTLFIFEQNWPNADLFFYLSIS